MAPILVIYNPTAGRNRVRALWPDIGAALQRAAVSFDAVATQAPGDAIKLAADAGGRYAAIVAVGGDGTVSEVVNGMLQGAHPSDTPALGIIPVGNGDDFAKMLPPAAPIGGACYDWRVAVGKIAMRKTALFDVGRFSSQDDVSSAGVRARYFLNVIEVGFGAHTVANFASVPRMLTGNLAYLAAVLKTMVRFPSLRLRIQFDDQEPFIQDTTIAAIGNGRCFGGGFWVCPDAVADDGLLDVMVASKLTRRTILKLLPKLQRGTHVGRAEVKMHRARRIILESSEPFLVEADGEMPLAPTRRLEVEVLPQRIAIMV